MDIQEKINDYLKQLNEAPDFKAYFKLQREIIHQFIGIWDYVEVYKEKDALHHYELLVKSFGEKLKLDEAKSKDEKTKIGLDDQKINTMKKFDEQILKSFIAKDYQKTSEQLFYVLLGNIIEHLKIVDVDLTKFDLAKDLYPKLKMPLSLNFFLFQNLTFGPIATKINALSPEYLQKYCALFLCLWRATFDFIAYENYQDQLAKEKEKPNADQEHVHTADCYHEDVEEPKKSTINIKK